MEIAVVVIFAFDLIFRDKKTVKAALHMISLSP